jgi:uncharacterized protein (DUF2237 family)
MGNDLSTPHPPSFPGLKPGNNSVKDFHVGFELKFPFSGDKWGLCAARWYEAQKAGVAPYVDLDATNEAALRVVPLDILTKYDVANANKTD